MRPPAQTLGQLAAMNRRCVPHDVDYSKQAKADFEWYASMTEKQLAAALRSMPVRRTQIAKCRDAIVQMWRECPEISYVEISQRLGCHYQYVSKVLREARG